MLMQILTHTPRWVFVLLIALIALGARQMTSQRVSMKRVAVLPLAMMGLGLLGVVTAFPQQPSALLGWALGLAGAAATVLSRPLPAGTQFDRSSHTFAVPGSGVPLALMMAIFFTKYAVGVTVAMQPALAGHLGFAAGVGTLYGLFSGVFLGRAARLWRLAMARTGAVNAAAAR